jgi:hypothetical protein
MGQWQLHDVCQWLVLHGYSTLVPAFVRNGIDGPCIASGLDDVTLEELGVTAALRPGFKTALANFRA